MTYTSFSAIIITFHHLSTILALIIAAIIGTAIFFFFAKGRKHQFIVATIGFLVSLVIGIFLSEALFQRTPINFEVVQAG